MMVVGYVVNAGRTKLLMQYNARRELWTLVGGILNRDEAPESALVRHVLEGTGLVARPIAKYDSDEPSIEAYILEADEDEASKYELEELYDAQWLTKDQVLSCTCIHLAAKDLAGAMLS